MNHPLCDGAVTLYRRTEDGVVRKVLTGCGLQIKKKERRDVLGIQREKSFLLVVPGRERLLPGDRIFPGVGPETEDWSSLHPALQEEIFQIAEVTPYYLGGVLCHTQARG